MSGEDMKPKDPGEPEGAEIQPPEGDNSGEEQVENELLDYEPDQPDIGEVSMLIQLFQKSMNSEDAALISTAPQMKLVLHNIAKGVFDLLGAVSGQSNYWPKENVEEFLSQAHSESTGKGLSKAAQQHLMLFWADFLPLFKKIILAELNTRELRLYSGEADQEAQKLQTKVEEVLQELDQQKEMTRQASQRASEQEKNASYMITAQRQLTEDLHEARKQLHKENPLFNGTVEEFDRAKEELLSYKKKEKEYERSCHQMKTELDNATHRCSQLEEGERLHLKKITEMEGRVAQLRAEVKKMEEESSWQKVGEKKGRSFAAVATPPGSPSAAASDHKEAEPSKRGGMDQDFVSQPGTSKTFVSGDFSTDGGLFSTFWVKDFSALITNTSLETSKGYLKRIQELKDKMYLDVKEAFSAQWEVIEPRATNLLPQASLEEKTKAFRHILKELCVARTPKDLYTRLQNLKKSPHLELAIPSNNYFLLPGLIPGRKDFVHVYNPTLESSNRATVQMLLALHLPQLWRHMALLEHFNDNLAKKTNFVYYPRKDASEFEVALHLVCVFVAEELFAFERHVQTRGFNQTAERLMVPDAIFFDQEYVHKVCELKGTPNNVKDIFLTSNPCSTFYSLYKTEKQKFRTLVNSKANPAAANKKTESAKRKSEDDGHLFD